MRSSEFSDAIREARRRVEELRHYAGESGSQTGYLAAVAIEALQVAFEEFEVADEDLREQNEALLAAREELELERQRYLDLFDAAPDGYVVTDPNGIITEVNVAAGQLCGVPPRFLVGKPLSVFVAEEARDVFRSRLNQLSTLPDAGTTKFEVRLQQREGKTFDAAISVAVVPDSRGTLTALRWLIRDITERKMMERQMSNANAELERRVLERTAELETANKLKDELLVREQQARLEAEAANKGKDEFLATLGHELRTPLNAIVGWTHILTSQPRDEKLIDHGVEVIKRNALSQSQIVNDILDVSRIITGKLRLDRAEVSLLQIVEAVLEALRPTADAKSIRIELTHGPAPRLVSGDPVRLQQVAWNLIANAIKFTPNGGTIGISVEYSDEVRLTVSDSGAGISPEFLPRLFERFRQADSTSTRKYGGLGLGLSIVRRLVELHGGQIVATSPGEGQGATFVVSLPAVAESGGRPADTATSADSQGADSKVLDGVWVVAVDDDPDGREVLKVCLQKAGARVTAASCCAEAVVAVRGMLTDQASRDSDREDDLSRGSRTVHPDLLVADIAMPDEDGFDLIRKVRTLPPEEGGKIPAIALTAYAAAEDRSRALAEGYQLHLAKPVAPAELVAAAAKLTQS